MVDKSVAVGQIIATEIHQAVEGLNIHEFDLTGLAKGMYFIKVTNDVDVNQTIKVALD